MRILRYISLAFASLWLFTAIATAHITPSYARLVDASGRPIGGRWQRWIDESKVPTIQGPVILGPQSLCDIPGVQPARGCSDWVAPWELYADGRDALYFELGHIFDYGRLTWRDRGRLAHIWGVYGHPWNDTDAALNQGREDGLAVDFAAAYQDCADGTPTTGLQSGDAPVIETRGTCAFIRTISRSGR